MVTGCAGNSGKTQSFYLLTARAQATAASTNTSVGIGPVRVAPFLQRPQMVTHDGSGDLRVADTWRWSEPLEQGIQRVLLQNLTALTGADTRNFPWTQNTIPHYALRIDVIDLDRGADGNALLEVSWILEDIAQNKMLLSRRDRLITPVAPGDNPTALATAYSELFAQLAQQMAQALLLLQTPVHTQTPKASH
ncbi:MAG: PqiC family protein [Spongiibacteraceae bacterium]